MPKSTCGRPGCDLDLIDPATWPIEEIGPFRPTLRKLIVSLGSPNVDFARLADVIESDPVITANTLKVVNSAAYAHRAAIISVRRAIAVLGMDRLRNIAFALSIGRVVRDVRATRFNQSLFNAHSIATAIISDQIAIHGMSSNRRPAFPEGAFIAGLLHDIGRLVLAELAPDLYDTIHALFQLGGVSMLDCEREVLSITHADIGGAAANAWGVGETIRQAVIHHHCPQCPQTARSLSEVVSEADTCANRMGLSMFRSGALTDGKAERAFADIGLPQTSYREFLATYNSIHVLL